MYTLIMQRNLYWYVTKRKYPSYKEEVVDYPDYMTSLKWVTVAETIQFIQAEWGLSEKEKNLFEEFDKQNAVDRIVLKSGIWQYE